MFPAPVAAGTSGGTTGGTPDPNQPPPGNPSPATFIGGAPAPANPSPATFLGGSPPKQTADQLSQQAQTNWNISSLFASWMK